MKGSTVLHSTMKPLRMTCLVLYYPESVPVKPVIDHPHERWCIWNDHSHERLCLWNPWWMTTFMMVCVCKTLEVTILSRVHVWEALDMWQPLWETDCETPDMWPPLWETVKPLTCDNHHERLIVKPLICDHHHERLWNLWHVTTIMRDCETPDMWPTSWETDCETPDMWSTSWETDCETPDMWPPSDSETDCETPDMWPPSWETETPDMWPLSWETDCETPGMWPPSWETGCETLDVWPPLCETVCETPDLWPPSWETDCDHHQRLTDWNPWHVTTVIRDCLWNPWHMTTIMSHHPYLHGQNVIQRVHFWYYLYLSLTVIRYHPYLHGQNLIQRLLSPGPKNSLVQTATSSDLMTLIWNVKLFRSKKNLFFLYLWLQLFKGLTVWFGSPAIVSKSKRCLNVLITQNWMIKYKHLCHQVCLKGSIYICQGCCPFLRMYRW